MSEAVVENLIRSGVVLVGAVLTYVLIVRFATRGVKSYMGRRDKEQAERVWTLWRVGRRLVLIAVLATAVLIIFGIWGFSLAPFLAVGTVLAAAVGFGAQDLVKDMIAGFFILIEDQFQIGDTVTIAGVTGTVEDVQLRVTVLRDLQGNAIFVPNGQITVSSNYTSRFAQPVIDVGVAYETDVDMALSVMEDELNLLARDPEWSDRIDGPCEILGVNELGDSSVTLRARLTTDADERWTVRREALRRIKIRFDDEGITIPFPQITVHQGG